MYPGFEDRWGLITAVDAHMPPMCSDQHRDTIIEEAKSYLARISGQGYLRSGPAQKGQMYTGD